MVRRYGTFWVPDAGEARDRALVEIIKQVAALAQSVHEAYHTDTPRAWRDCPHAACQRAQEITAVAQEALTGSGK